MDVLKSLKTCTKNDELGDFIEYRTKDDEVVAKLNSKMNISYFRHGECILQIRDTECGQRLTYLYHNGKPDQYYQGEATTGTIASWSHCGNIYLDGNTEDRTEDRRVRVTHKEYGRVTIQSFKGVLREEFYSPHPKAGIMIEYDPPVGFTTDPIYATRRFSMLDHTYSQPVPKSYIFGLSLRPAVLMFMHIDWVHQWFQKAKVYLKDSRTKRTLSAHGIGKSTGKCVSAKRKKPLLLPEHGSTHGGTRSSNRALGDSFQVCGKPAIRRMLRRGRKHVAESSSNTNVTFQKSWIREYRDSITLAYASIREECIKANPVYTSLWVYTSAFDKYTSAFDKSWLKEHRRSIKNEAFKQRKAAEDAEIQRIKEYKAEQRRLQELEVLKQAFKERCAEKNAREARMRQEKERQETIKRLQKEQSRKEQAEKNKQAKKDKKMKKKQWTPPWLQANSSKDSSTPPPDSPPQPVDICSIGPESSQWPLNGFMTMISPIPQMNMNMYAAPIPPTDSPVEEQSVFETNTQAAPESLPYPSTLATRSATQSECVICMDAKTTHLIVPCGHKCICAQCAKEVDQTNSCPVCRQDIIMVVPVFEM